jgi:hypothetical protein
VAKLGNVAYRLVLPPSLAGVHKVFHVSQLMKYLKPLTDVIVDDVAPLDANLSYLEHQVKLLGQQVRVMRQQMIRFYRVQWSCQSKQEATWETEDFLHSKYLEFFLHSDACVPLL